MFSCYNQILVCGVHLWLIFFFIRKIPLQKNKWNFNVLQHDVPGVWRKLLRRTWRRRIQFTHLYGAEDKVYLHVYAIFLVTLSLSLSLSLSPLISLQVWIQKFWKWLRSKRGDEMNLIYMYIKKSNMCIDYIYFSFFPYWISIYDWFQ